MTEERRLERNEKNLIWRRTRRGLLCMRLMTHKQKAKRRGWPMPDYDLEYLLARFIGDRTFERVYAEWVKAGYPRHLAPSIDRIDASQPYRKDNIQMMTTEQNYRKADLYERARTEVIMCDAEGNDIRHFRSMTAAAYFVGGSIGDIGSCCLNQNYSHKGYRWKYGNKRKYEGNKSYRAIPQLVDEDKEFKKSVVAYWQDNPGLTAADVALHFGLPEFKQLYNWRYSIDGRQHQNYRRWKENKKRELFNAQA